MIPVVFRHSWNAGQTEEQEMEQMFGKMLCSFDKSEAYEVERSLLFKDAGAYTWISANGCSCWDGDYDGWTLDEAELKTLAEKTKQNGYDWRDTADVLVAKWVLDNIQ